MPTLTTEAARLAHPLARNIPRNAWIGHPFLQCATDTELQRTQGALAEASAPLQPGESPLKSLLCLLYGHSEVAPEPLLSAARAMGCTEYTIFTATACAGRADLLDVLAQEMTPELREQAITARDYEAYRHAAQNGHLNILEHIEGLMTEPQKQAALQADDYYAYRFAAENGHLNILEHLEGLMTETRKQAALQDNNYYAYRLAAANGHLSILERLEGLMTETQKQAALQADGYYAYRLAAENGHLNILEHLEGLMTETRKQAVLQAFNYSAYLLATANGHLNILEHLEGLMTETQKQAALQVNDYYAYRLAAANGHLNILEHLLRNHQVFAWAEMHIAEYGHHVRPFAEARLRDWQEASDAFAENNHNGVFNLNEADSRLAFYVARHLIRENTAEASEQLRFLMGIPGVATLAHQAVTPTQPNGLLRLALTCQNQGAAEILLTLAPVRALAEANAFYANEAQGGFDLRAIAEDRESSMRALAPAERRRLERANTHYGPTAQSLGVDNLLEVLRERLRERYLDHPASITLNGATINLPLTWLEFENLGLEGEARSSALKAYHAHADHAALRWLLNPNPWMAENAGYAEGNPGTHTGYSTFGNYRDLIALLWLAASDENTRPTDGHTLEGRIDHFVNELALIGRAHNWDRQRPTRRADGTEAFEEYDDEEGDKPSCYSGVNRRLFQSVIGHPLLQPFGNDLLEDELRDFARDHFTSRITTDNHALLLGAKKSMKNSEPLSDDQLKAMKSLDINEEQSSKFLARMQAKYSSEWTPACTAFLQNRLALTEDGATTHVSALWFLTDFSSLLKSRAPAQNALPSVVALSIFAASPAAPSSSESRTQSLPDDEHPSRPNQ